jgi:hypothetical protein
MIQHLQTNGIGCGNRIIADSQGVCMPDDDIFSGAAYSIDAINCYCYGSSLGNIISTDTYVYSDTGDICYAINASVAVYGGADGGNSWGNSWWDVKENAPQLTN